MSNKSTTPRTKTTSIKKVAKPAPKATSRDTVDYYPNKMTVAVSALAGASLVLLALMVVY
ncbi:hypothetical protein FJZ39_01505 [Candidatus Saccharibacteria bacterium]|nr:hypothetical protein [Candidatus Saccharibacteria bacterium]